VRFGFWPGRPPDRAAEAPRPPIVALVVDSVFPYHLGGREVRYHELTKRLADDAAYHVFTMNWWQGTRTLVDGNITYHAISRLHPMYAKGRRSIPQALWFAVSCLRLFAYRFDILEADHIPYFQILVLRVIATLKRKRFVVTWHEVWGPGYWRKYVGTLGPLAWLIEWLAMRSPDHIIAASAQTGERLQAILGSRASITVAANGVDLAAIGGADPDEQVTDLVVVGRLIGHKRIDMLLDAMAVLHADGTPVSCRVIGDGPERESLHEQAAQLGLADFVDFRPDVREQKEVFSLVKAAKAAVFPSDREGFGAAVLEALACGIPVVTTNSPDNLSQHLVTRSVRGYVCEPTVGELAQTLRTALSRSAADTGRVDSWVADYSWDSVASKVSGALRIPLASAPGHCAYAELAAGQLNPE
jgi:glycosyltransferase involved in cell wall biosynthesis